SISQTASQIINKKTGRFLGKVPRKPRFLRDNRRIWVEIGRRTAGEGLPFAGEKRGESPRPRHGPRRGGMRRGVASAAPRRGVAGGRRDSVGLSIWASPVDSCRAADDVLAQAAEQSFGRGFGEDIERLGGSGREGGRSLPSIIKRPGVFQIGLDFAP